MFGPGAFNGIFIILGGVIALAVFLAGLGSELFYQYGMRIASRNPLAPGAIKIPTKASHFTGPGSTWLTAKLPYAIAVSLLVMIIGGIWSFLISGPAVLSKAPVPKVAIPSVKPPEKPRDDKQNQSQSLGSKSGKGPTTPPAPTGDINEGRPKDEGPKPESKP